MQNLRPARRAQPFVAVVTTPRLQIRARSYVEYLQYALAAAIGWLMPGVGWGSRLRFVMAAADFAGYPPGTDGTERLAGYLDGLAAACPARFARWRVQQAVWLPADAEYLAYADGLAYLGQRSLGGQAIREATAFDRWVPRLDIAPDRLPDMLADRDSPVRSP